MAISSLCRNRIIFDGNGFFGVSTLLFDDSKIQILIDGFFSRPSLSQVMSHKIQSQPEVIQQIIQQQHLHRTQVQQNYLDQTLTTLKPKLLVPIHWNNFFQAGTQPREFLPYLADDTDKSLKILIQAAEQQKIHVILLSQPVSYPLDPALHS